MNQVYTIRLPHLKAISFFRFHSIFLKTAVFFEILDVFYNIFLSQSCFRSHFSPRYITETIGWQTEKVSQHPFAVKQNSTILYGVRITDKYKLYTTRPILYSTSFKSFLHPKQNQWRKVLTNEFIEWELFQFYVEQVDWEQIKMLCLGRKRIFYSIYTWGLAIYHMNAV